MKIGIINGANLNLIGVREPKVYGNKSLKELNEELAKSFPEIEFEFYHSNVEGEIVNAIHKFSTICDGIILNAGGYTHNSVVIYDAIKAVNIPVIEVHLSNVFARESFRHKLLTSAACLGVISGFGYYSYILGVNALINHIKK